eukprot:3020763-Rhodomonas_salina.1
MHIVRLHTPSQRQDAGDRTGWKPAQHLSSDTPKKDSSTKGNEKLRNASGLLKRDVLHIVLGSNCTVSHTKIESETRRKIRKDCDSDTGRDVFG